MYDENWARFQDVATVELDFLDRSPEEQYRLNRFKLWALEHGGIVTLEKKNILEFGAGHGRMAIEFPVFASYTGVDLSPNLVRIGEERLAMAGLADRAQLVACDCMDYQAPEEAFDVVCSLGMFPHIEHPEPVLRKMVTHLKPGGMLFIDVDQSSPLYDQVRRLRWSMGVTIGGTRHLFSRKQLNELFYSVGLTDVRVVMREYPFLGGIYARRGWRWVLTLRNWMAARSWLDVLGVNFFVFGVKPKEIPD